MTSDLPCDKTWAGPGWKRHFRRLRALQLGLAGTRKLRPVRERRHWSTSPALRRGLTLELSPNVWTFGVTQVSAGLGGDGGGERCWVHQRGALINPLFGFLAKMSRICMLGSSDFQRRIENLRQTTVSQCEFTYNMSQMVCYNYTGVEFLHIFSYISVITCCYSSHLQLPPSQASAPIISDWLHALSAHRS